MGLGRARAEEVASTLIVTINHDNVTVVVTLSECDVNCKLFEEPDATTKCLLVVNIQRYVANVHIQ